jgi:oligosaccharide repeat unit polymerase
MDLSYTGVVELSPEDFQFLLARRGDDLLFGLAIMLLVLVSMYAIKRVLLGEAVSFRRITLPSFFLLLYIVFLSVPSVLWFALSLDDTRTSTFLIVQAAPLAILLGVAVATTAFENPVRTIVTFVRSPIRPSSIDGPLTGVFWICLGLALLCVGTYLRVAQTVPLFVSLSRYGQLGGDTVRFAIYDSPEWVQFLYALAVRFLFPFAVLCAYFQWSTRRGRWGILLIISGLIAGICAALTLERSNGLGLFATVLLALYVRNGRITRPQVALFALALVGGGLTHRAQYQLDISLSSIPEYMLTFLGSRVLLDPSYMTFVAFQQYNEVNGFLFGRSIRLLSLIGFGNYESFSAVGFVGDLWANYGLLGVLVGSFIIGVVLQLCQLVLFRQKNVLTSIVFVLLLLNSVWIMYGSVLSLMVVVVYALSTALALIVIILERQNRRPFSRLLQPAQ